MKLVDVALLKQILKYKELPLVQNLFQYRHTCYILLLAALTLGAIYPAPPAWAATYFVAPSGSDNNSGTLASPWRTIQQAANTLQAGDIVFIRGGTYREHVRLSRSGTSGRHITYANYRNEKAIIEGTGLSSIRPYGALVEVDKQSYITLKGLELRNSPRNGIRVTTGTHVTLEYLTVDGVNDSGIIFDNNPSPAYSIVRHCTIRNATLAGILLWSNTGGYYVIEHNKVYDNEGRNNYDGIQGGDSPYLIVRHNEVHSIGSAGDYIDFGGDERAPVSRTHHIVAEKNLVYRGKGGGGGFKLNNRATRVIYRNNSLHGIGFAFYEQPLKAVAIYHNTVVESQGHAVQLWNAERPGGFGGIEFKNNFFGFSTRRLLQHIPNRVDGSPANILLDGNVYRFTPGQGIGWAMNDGDHIFDSSQSSYNAWRSLTRQENQGGTYTTASLSASFVDAPTRNFHLAANSPAIDAGHPLTTTTSAGSGTRIPVAASFYFHDGYGMVQGDLIQVGSNSPVRIVKIDEAQNILQVNTAITWNLKDSVNLPYSGTAPDAGAFETTMPGPRVLLSAPHGLRFLMP